MPSRKYMQPPHVGAMGERTMRDESVLVPACDRLHASTHMSERLVYILKFPFADAKVRMPACLALAGMRNLNGEQYETPYNDSAVAVAAAAAAMSRPPPPFCNAAPAPTCTAAVGHTAGFP